MSGLRFTSPLDVSLNLSDAWLTRLDSHEVCRGCSSNVNFSYKTINEGNRAVRFALEFSFICKQYLNEIGSIFEEDNRKNNGEGQDANSFIVRLCKNTWRVFGGCKNQDTLKQCLNRICMLYTLFKKVITITIARVNASAFKKVTEFEIFLGDIRFWLEDTILSFVYNAKIIISFRIK